MHYSLSRDTWQGDWQASRALFLDRCVSCSRSLDLRFFPRLVSTPLAQPEALGSSLTSADRSQGGLTLEEASARMRAGLGFLEAWGLENEVVEWGYALPTYEELHDALFQRAAILEWDTVN